MRRGPLVERHQFVGFRPRQLAAAVGQLAEPVPLRRVRRDEDVHIHGATLSVATLGRVHEESELVTGEAVVLDLRVAKLASRALAMVLDVLVQFALLLGAFFMLMLTVPGEDESLALTLILVFLVLIMVGYPVLFETLSRGRSLGKMAVGLRVVRVDGGPIRFRHALTRGSPGSSSTSGRSACSGRSR